MTRSKRPSSLVAAEPFAKLALNIPRISFPSIPTIDVSNRWAESMRPMLEMGEKLRKQMAPFTRLMEKLRPRLEWWMREDAKCKRLEKAGWLPHSTSPDIDDDELSEKALSVLVETHYRDNWQSIRSSFANAAQEYDIDEEAKETFLEALAAHEAGLHRCPARLLFPEIERVSRREIHGGAMDKIASQGRLRDAIGGLIPAEIAESGVYGIRLYFKLSDHLYAHVKDAESLAKILADPSVPNRHAALHGYASYDTFQTSINALIIADFLFQAISTIKRLAREDAQASHAA